MESLQTFVEKNQTLPTHWPRFKALCSKQINQKLPVNYIEGLSEIHFYDVTEDPTFLEAKYDFFDNDNVINNPLVKAFYDISTREFYHFANA